MKKVLILLIIGFFINPSFGEVPKRKKVGGGKHKSYKAAKKKKSKYFYNFQTQLYDGTGKHTGQYPKEC